MFILKPLESMRITSYFGLKMMRVVINFVELRHFPACYDTFSPLYLFFDAYLFQHPAPPLHLQIS